MIGLKRSMGFVALGVCLIAVVLACSVGMTPAKLLAKDNHITVSGGDVTFQAMPTGDKIDVSGGHVTFNVPHEEPQKVAVQEHPNVQNVSYHTHYHMNGGDSGQLVVYHIPSTNDLHGPDHERARQIGLCWQRQFGNIPK